MTEQSPSDRLNRASNEIFEATSFLNGTNAAYVEQMYAAWLADPNSVDASWQAYFAQAGDQGLSPTQLGRGQALVADLREVGLPALIDRGGIGQPGRIHLFDKGGIGAVKERGRLEDFIGGAIQPI